jgi:predicted amidophosphoribosyltransferase
MNEKAAVAIDQKLKESFVIIIDDVITTGSTMKEAVLTLRSAGFANVYGLSVAH